MSDIIELNYGTFGDAIYPYCQDLTGIEEFIKKKVYSLDEMTRDFFDKYILLAAGLTDDEVEKRIEGGLRKNGGLTASQLSRYRRCKNKEKDINVGIWDAYLSKGAISKIESHFKKYLIPTIIQNGELGILYDLWQLIKNDSTIPRIYREQFESLYSKEKLPAFLAEVFSFAITRYRSVDIKLIEEEERKKPKLHPLIAGIIRDVRIHKDLSTLNSSIEIIRKAMNAESPEEISTGLTWYDGAMLWRETHEFIDESELDIKTRGYYLSLKTLSYILEQQNLIEMQTKGLRELTIRYGFLDDSGSVTNTPNSEKIWTDVRLSEEDET